MDSAEGTKIKTLLHYWIAHNKEHSQEFREWATRVKTSGETEAGEEMLLAARKMDQASEILSRALRRLERKER